MGSSVSSAVGRPRTAAKWPPLALLVGGGGGFWAVAADLLAHGWLAQCDHPIQYYFHEHSTPAMVVLFAAISGLGELALIAPLGLVVGARLLAKRRWRGAFGWGLALIGSGILNAVLKPLFHVPRPGRFTYYVFERAGGYSFPSGHTMGASIAAGALALVILHSRPVSPGRRWMALAIVAALSLLVAFALVYLGVHYLTDVLAALAVSAAWLGVIRWILPPATWQGKVAT